MMVGSWPCKVSSKIHVNGRRVGEPVCEDKGKTMATEPEDEKDPKRACVVLSKGHEVVGPGHSRLTGAAAKVTDMGVNSGNSSRVNQNSSVDRQAGRVSKTEQHYLSQVNQNSSADR
jgi:hypothetical protein